MSVVTGEKKKRGRPRKQKVVIESDEDEPLQTYTSLESAAAAADTPSAAAADSESQQPDEYNSAAGETTPYSSQPSMQVRIYQVVISGLLLYFEQKLLLLM